MIVVFFISLKEGFITI